MTAPLFDGGIAPMRTVKTSLARIHGGAIFHIGTFERYPGHERLGPRQWRCISRSGRGRDQHELDKDGVCIFCDRRVGRRKES